MINVLWEGKCIWEDLTPSGPAKGTVSCVRDTTMGCSYASILTALWDTTACFPSLRSYHTRLSIRYPCTTLLQVLCTFNRATSNCRTRIRDYPDSCDVYRQHTFSRKCSEILHIQAYVGSSLKAVYTGWIQTTYSVA